MEQTEFDFSVALQHLKDGNRVARRGWNGSAMFIFLVSGSRFEVNRPPLKGIFAEGTPIEYSAHIDICFGPGKIAVWTPSQVDMMAEDWVLS